MNKIVLLVFMLNGNFSENGGASKSTRHEHPTLSRGARIDNCLAAHACQVLFVLVLACS